MLIPKEIKKDLRKTSIEDLKKYKSTTTEFLFKFIFLLLIVAGLCEFYNVSRLISVVLTSILAIPIIGVIYLAFILDYEIHTKDKKSTLK